jgi:ribosomal protein S18 acetylase RimI-like enzyme
MSKYYHSSASINGVFYLGYIRPAARADSERILELEGKLFPNSLSEPMIQQELRIGRGWVHCGEKDNTVYGYALVRDDGYVLDLTRLGVDLPEQGGGIGRELLTHVLQVAAEERRGVQLTVLKDNEKALKFYLRHGFQIVGHLKKEGAWLMRKA